MPITYTWDASKPVSGDLVSQGPAEFQTHWAALTERLRRGGHRWETTASVDTEAGRHYCGAEYEFDAGLNADHEFTVYDKNRTSKILRVKGQTHADSQKPAIEVIGAGGSGYGYVIGRRDSTLVFPVSPAGVGRVPFIFQNRGNGTITILSAKLECFTAPTGTLDVDIKRLTSGYTNPTTGGSTIFTARPTITTGNYVGTEVTGFVGGMDALAVGYAWVIDVISSNNADGVNLIVKAWHY